MDNPFVIPTAGQADWDSALTADINAIDRGYHITERAGIAISTGQVLWLNSGGFFFPFDPNSTSIFPHAFAYTGAASGDSMTALLWGIVRSLGINSAAIPGFDLFVSTKTPGLIVTSDAVMDRKVGVGLEGNGIVFRPSGIKVASSDFIMTTTLTAAAAINSGYAVWLDPAANTAKHFDPNSEAINPTGLALTGGAGVGSLFTALLRGTIRTLSIASAPPIGLPAYVSALTPGLLVGSYAASNRPMGLNIGSQAIHIDPLMTDRFTFKNTSSVAISAVVGSLHTFNVSLGRFGWNRQTVMIGNSGDFVTVKFYADAARSTLLYSTKSGGVNVVGSFQDRAGWPWENTDAATLGDLIYGTLKMESACTIGSDTISVRGIWDREK